MENDADEIIPRLWQGSAPPNTRSVAQDGFTAVVLCAWEYQPESFEGVQHVLRCPIDDVRNPSESHFKLAFETGEKVARLHSEGHNILVACMAGLNRSGLVSAFSLHLIHGWPGNFCAELIKQKRKPFARSWDPYYPDPLNNRAFLARVLTLKGFDNKKLTRHTATP